MASRSESKTKEAISDIKTSFPDSKGSLIFQYLNLGDLSTIKSSVEQFTSKEKELHVLFNNAGVQVLTNDGPTTKTVQGHEIHLGVNVLGTFLFTELLTPTLVETAKTSPPNTVRVVWVSSLGTEMVGEKSLGISTDYLDYYPSKSPLERYGISKAGNWLHGVEFARRYKESAVVSIPCNPGHLRSDLYRDSSVLFRMFLNTFIAYPVVNGAYTELFAGLAPAITMRETGGWGGFPFFFLHVFTHSINLFGIRVG